MCWNVNILRSSIACIRTVGVNISTQTVRNHLRQSDLRSSKACIRIPLTRPHKQAHWTGHMITSSGLITIAVLFTDESRYCLDFTDRRARVGSDFKDADVSEHDRYGGSSIWCGVLPTCGIHTPLNKLFSTSLFPDSMVRVARRSSHLKHSLAPLLTHRYHPW